MMTKMFRKPKVGLTVTVTTDWSDYFKPFDSATKRKKTYTGIVVENAKYDDPSSFRMATGDHSYPIRIISLDHVVSLVDATGKAADKVESKKNETSVWEVKSDSRKGGSYTVTREGNHFSCTCVGYGFRKSCRHILQIKSKVR